MAYGLIKLIKTIRNSMHNNISILYGNYLSVDDVHRAFDFLDTIDVGKYIKTGQQSGGGDDSQARHYGRV